MIKTQDEDSSKALVDFPVFSDAGTKTKPDDAKYSAGFLAGDVLPAEWLNYFLNKDTSGITRINDGLLSTEKELNNVVTAGGQTPSEDSDSQVLAAIKYLIAQGRQASINAAHPVGSLYWTSSSEDPAVTFPGTTWKQIKDTFVLAAGDTYKAEATGGKASVTLTEGNLPAHSHSITSGTTYPGTISGVAATVGTKTTKYVNKGGQGSFGPYFSQNATSGDITHGSYGYTKTEYTNVIDIQGYTGFQRSPYEATKAFDILPPYIVKYCWERTA